MVDTCPAISLDFLSNLYGCHTVSLRQCPGDLAAVAQMSNLTTLILEDAALPDISPLRTTASLRQLLFPTAQVVDLSSLHGRADLEVLVGRGATVVGANNIRVLERGTLGGISLQTQVPGRTRPDS